MKPRSNVASAALLGLIVGWVLQSMGVAHGSFVLYALVLAGTGLVGAAFSGNILAAPVGLIIGQVLATLLMSRIPLTPESLVAVPSAAIAVLAGMAGRPLHARWFQRQP